VRVAVICKDGGTAAMEARSLGAVAVGETEVFAMIREGRMNFDRLICHTDSEQALQRAGLGRILGPKGLMPSAKTNTVSSDIKGLMQDMLGAEAYRERDATIRLRVGQLGFTPQMLADNVKAVMNRMKDDIAKLEDTIEKAIHEVVLSSTNSPGFSLNGAFKSEDPAAAPEKLAGMM
jgi:large subunit ribosomal protein L1